MDGWMQGSIGQCDLYARGVCLRAGRVCDVLWLWAGQRWQNWRVCVMRGAWRVAGKKSSENFAGDALPSHTTAPNSH